MVRAGNSQAQRWENAAEGIFFGEEMGKRNRDSLGMIGLGQGFGNFQLANQGGGKAGGEGHHVALVALGFMDMKSGLNHVEIFDAQVKGFANPESASIEQMNNQPGGVVMHIGDRREQLKHLGLGGAVTDGGWALGAEGSDGAEWLFQHLAIKEEQRIEGLILGGSRNVGSGEVGQERFDLPLGGRGSRLAFGEKAAVASKPLGVRLLGAEREVF